jgi:K+-sensing histidine kinase KdpD
MIDMDLSYYQNVDKLSNTQIAEILKELENLDYIRELVNALPYIGAILTKERQIVFMNEQTRDFLGENNIKSILGQRPGEAVKCINAEKGPKGCGSSENCAVCGAFRSIAESQHQSEKSVKECRITVKDDEEKLKALDLKITSTPFQWKDHAFTIFVMEDISDSKRRRLMEKIFYHDLMNRSSSLSGFLQILNDTEEPEQVKHFTRVLMEINQELIDEITAQREIAAAESGELKVSISSVSLPDLLNSIAEHYQTAEFANNKDIRTDDHIPDIVLKTDKTLVKRCLINMVKNALEASNEKQIVKLGATHYEKILRLWVNNEGFIPRKIQLQIFQRSFSTKDPSRGLGTYSIKILSENYLGYKANFTTSEESGTTFFIDITYSV